MKWKLRMNQGVKSEYLATETDIWMISMRRIRLDRGKNCYISKKGCTGKERYFRWSSVGAAEIVSSCDKDGWFEASQDNDYIGTGKEKEKKEPKRRLHKQNGKSNKMAEFGVQDVENQIRWRLLAESHQEL